MLSLDIDDDLKLVIHKHIGDVTPTSLANAWLTFMQTRAFKEMGYNLLSDYRDAKFTFILEELVTARGYLKRNRPILQGKKEAIITNEPYTTAVSALFERYAKEDAGLELRIFVTESAALRWIMDCHRSCHCSLNTCQLREDKAARDFLEKLRTT